MAGPFLVWKLDVIDLTATATEETVVTVMEKTQEVLATRAARKEIEDSAMSRESCQQFVNWLSGSVRLGRGGW